MELLSQEWRSRLPPLYAQEQIKDPTIFLKYFTPDANWTWYATEGSQEGDDFVFFGYVIGLEAEWGYFTLSELTSIRGPLNLPVERDLYFKPAPFSTVIRS